jgi:type IV pilus modification protein PilV
VRLVRGSIPPEGGTGRRVPAFRSPDLAGGFSLVEVLAATLVISVGALAVATMQRSATRERQLAYTREVAVTLAEELLEKAKQLKYTSTDLNNTSSSFVNPPASLSPTNRLNEQGLHTATAADIYDRKWRIDDSSPVANVKLIRVRVIATVLGRSEQVVLSTRKAK